MVVAPSIAKQNHTLRATPSFYRPFGRARCGHAPHSLGLCGPPPSSKKQLLCEQDTEVAMRNMYCEHKKLVMRVFFQCGYTQTHIHTDTQTHTDTVTHRHPPPTPPHPPTHQPSPPPPPTQPPTQPANHPPTHPPEGLGYDLHRLQTGIALCLDLPPDQPDFCTQMRLLGLGDGGIAAFSPYVRQNVACPVLAAGVCGAGRLETATSSALVPRQTTPGAPRTAGPSRLNPTSSSWSRDWCSSACSSLPKPSAGMSFPLLPNGLPCPLCCVPFRVAGLWPFGLSGMAGSMWATGMKKMRSTIPSARAWGPSARPWVCRE